MGMRDLRGSRRGGSFGKMLGAAIAASMTTLGAPSADAFCGFYVSGADTKLFNNATHVVLMREGTRTVLSMQNNYQGPPQNFAMVVPVPVVLQKENVKTLPKEVFAHIDQLSAPRLVEYWEQDPCMQEKWKEESRRRGPAPPAKAAAPMADRAEDLGVRIEAKFTVGEYDVVVLSARDSGGLDTWLRQENYKIPDGAEPYLKPYVQAGSKFFVAKVDVSKVKFESPSPGTPAMAMLSPLRFHYDTETFSLPVRLGLMNSGGTQDLIVNILAHGQRYEVANYPNAAIPTNFDVAEGAKGQFGSFYAALFDRTLEKIPKAVVTEYAWDASTCDPCPTPPLSPSEIQVLGADVFADTSANPDCNPPFRIDPQSGRKSMKPQCLDDQAPVRARPVRMQGGFVLTRLHARYAKDSLGEDLVFRSAPAIVGGREVRGEKGALENGAKPSSVNNFQGRYAVRHPWTGPIACKNPQRGIWGGPPGGGQPKQTPATNTAFAPRGKMQLATIVKGPVPDVLALPGAVTPLGSPVVPVPAAIDAPIDAADGGFGSSSAGQASDAGAPPSSDAGPPGPPPVPPQGGCGCVAGQRSDVALGGLLAGLALAIASYRRSRRR